MDFKNLHIKNSPLLICNVWDVSSSKIAASLGFNAIGTSSAAIATMLGYEDGRGISFDELLYIVERISKSIELPLSVDMEEGYGANPDEIYENILALINCGVVGINLEDSGIRDGKRTLTDTKEFSQSLHSISSILKSVRKEVFINIRTDTYLLDINNALEETIRRGKLYKEAGADGLFVPCIVEPDDMRQVASQVHLPLNVMCMPDLPDFETLGKLGVKRISMGNFCFNEMNKYLMEELNCILKEGSFKSLFR